MSQFHKLTIKEVIKETKDAVSLLFDIPNTLQSDFSFKAGQYITIKKEINGQEVRRAYSLCSSPKSGTVKVAVKAVEDGTFSIYANNKLKVGDTVEVATPEGKFIIEPTANKNYLAFAAGSGITPVIAMVKAVLESDTKATFTLVYGNKSVADTIFYKELNTLNDQYPDQFKLHYIFSRENIEGTVFGRIDEEHVNYFIKNIYKDIAFDTAFLCVPEEMINIASETLKKNNFDAANILFELFTASSIEEASSIDVKDGQSEIKVVIDEEETTFTMKQDDTILAASLRNKLDPPYSCQGGICSSCIAKVTEGKAVMSKNSILTDEELAEGIILTCIAHPTTPTITVDYDDA